ELAVAPVELARLHNHAAHGGAMAADIFRGRVHHDVRAPLDRPAQVGRGHGVVDDKGNLGLVRDLRERLDVDNVDERVAERLGVEQLGVLADGAAEVFRLIRGHECRVDAELLEIDVQQRVRAAVERGGGDDVVAARAERQDRGDLGGLAGRAGKRRAAAFERGHALLEHRHRRVRDARIDVAEGLQVEKAGGMVRGVEDERGRLIDRRGARAGGGVRNLPGVQGERFETELAIRHRRILAAAAAPADYCGGSDFGVEAGCSRWALVARRYSDGGTPTWVRKKRVKLLWAEKPSSAATSPILPRPEESREIAVSMHSMSR